ncbi:5-hydroxytryptamine receptor 1-like [Acipenser ruthenus]|uniref:5-hydroxytryptamine receptor 1-like n=1 Tax=Acipenser ruthenus TaxID=7906 RepID=UPI002741E7F4|nr:5-hydroxytryptamine receptor 1-like [Acipenser ruthenus]
MRVLRFLGSLEISATKMHRVSAANGSFSARIFIQMDTPFLVPTSLVLVFTLIAGIFGNVLVCCVVYKCRSLQTANNALLVNLAANDLLKCTLDIPLFMLAVLFGRIQIDLGELICIMQQFTYSLSSCVQLTTLVIISAERFQAIAHPFETDKRKLRIKFWILMIWTCGFSMSVLSVTLAKDTPLYLMCRHLPLDAQSYFNPFGTYVLVPSWAVSLALILFNYLRIFAVVRQHANKIFDAGILSQPTSGKTESTWQNVTTAGPLHRSQDNSGQSAISQAEESAQAAAESTSVPALQSSSSGTSPPKAPEFVGAVCLLTATSREHAKKSIEGKVAKRFGYIIIAFLVFWMPVVVILLLNFFLEKDLTNITLLLKLETLAVALTCAPAAVNPFIYTVVNRQFRCEFRKVFNKWRNYIRGS